MGNPVNVDLFRGGSQRERVAVKHDEIYGFRLALLCAVSITPYPHPNLGSEVIRKVCPTAEKRYRSPSLTKPTRCPSPNNFAGVLVTLAIARFSGNP